MTVRVDLNPRLFDGLFESQGVKVLWEQAMFCPCLGQFNRDSGQPDFNCVTCHGSGFLYLPPKEIKVFVSNFSSQKEFQQIGMLEKGTAYVTSSWDNLMGYHDRLTFVDFSSKHCEIFEFNNNLSEKTFRPAKALLNLASLTETFDVRDFTIEQGRFIRANVPLLNGTKVSVLYLTSPSYIIIDLVHELRATYRKFKFPENTFLELPKQYLVRREDFIYGPGGNSN